MIFDVRDARFERLFDMGAQFEPIAANLQITEGTIWHPRDNYLVFSDLAHGIVYRWSETDGLSLLRKPSNIANGNYVDRQGRILSCEHATSCVSRIEHDGRYVSVLASHYRGKPFNSPNDIVVDSRDRVWFTDPTYGRTSPRVGIARPLELGFQGVYRLDPDGSVALVADDYAQPNGLCFLPGEEELLVNDTDREHIRRYRVLPDGSLSGGDVLATIAGDGPGKPDGMKVDAEGHVFCTGPGGVHVLSDDGHLLGIVRTPEQARNLCFGGPGFDHLFIAASSLILRLRTRTVGIAPPRAD